MRGADEVWCQTGAWGVGRGGCRPGPHQRRFGVGARGRGTREREPKSGLYERGSGAGNGRTRWTSCGNQQFLHSVGSCPSGVPTSPLEFTQVALPAPGRSLRPARTDLGPRVHRVEAPSDTSN